MKKFFLTILIFTTVFAIPNNTSKRQTVGVVLSGGGAKGMAHIGILKVLEENNIPIDYICGTSIGGLVGGLYAMGYSPDEIYEIFHQEQFLDWMYARISTEDKYLFRKKEKDPTVFDVRIDEKVNVNIPSSILPSHTLNLIMMQYSFQGSEACKNNYDSLYVPFFCVGADINAEEPVIFNKGDLGVALRGTMSIPLVFEPLEIDESIIVDGGVENNFPLDIMNKKYNPDIVIGSQVVKGNQTAKSGNMISQIVALIMKNTNFNIPKDKGLLIKNNMGNMEVMDFHRVAEGFNIGYRNALDSIHLINDLVKVRQDSLVRNKLRKKYRDRFKKSIYGDIKVVSENEVFNDYVRMVFNPDKNMSFEEVKSKYYKLIEDDIIDVKFVKSVYDQTQKYFILELYVEENTDSYTGVGLDLASNDILQFYLTYNKNFFLDRPSELNSSFSVGTFSRFFEANSKIFFNLNYPFYLSSKIGILNNDYNRNEGERIYHIENPTKLRINSINFATGLGFPVTRSSVLNFSADYSINTFRFDQEITDDKFDKSNFNMLHLNTKFYSNTLNDQVFPKYGSKIELSVSGKYGQEEYQNEAETIKLKSDFERWFEFAVSLQNYKKLNKVYNHGFLFDIWMSTKPKMLTYMSDLALNPRFLPNKYFETVFRPEFISHSYASFGYVSIFNLTYNLMFRNSVYAFLPAFRVDKVLNTTNQLYTPRYSDGMENIFYYNNISFIQNTLIGPLSVELNTTYTNEFNFHFVVNFGFKIFRNPSYYK